MIVRIFSSGISKGEGPVNYLLSDKDHTGKSRAVKPEVLEGSPSTTVDIINNIDRKWKYVSGVIAFRHNEQPTQSQMLEIVSQFKSTFCAGLTADQFNTLFVLHRDKGNTEIHFVVPMIELTTGKRLNIHPPGQKNQDLYETFTKVVNHEMGYEQVIPDQLKLISADHTLKSPELKENHRKTRVLEQYIQKAVKSGVVSNRNELCQWLDQELGITVTRQGKDYISVKLTQNTKAHRLRGPLFEAQANYRDILAVSRKSSLLVTLTSTEYQEQKNRLHQLTNDRSLFHQATFLQKRPVRLGGEKIIDINAHPLPKTTTKEKTMSKPDTNNIIEEALTTMALNKPTRPSPKPISDKKQIINNIHSMRERAFSPTSYQNSENANAIYLTLSQLEESIQGVLIEIAHASNPTQKQKAEKKLWQLNEQKRKLLASLIAAQTAKTSKLKRG